MDSTRVGLDAVVEDWQEERRLGLLLWSRIHKWQRLQAIETKRPPFSLFATVRSNRISAITALSLEQTVGAIYGGLRFRTEQYEELQAFYAALKLCMAAAVKGESLSTQLLQEWHKTLIPGGGNWRTKDAFVSFEDGPEKRMPCFRLEARLVGILLQLNRSIGAACGDNERIIAAAARFVHAMEEIHPFPDGNGRLGRLCLHFLLRRVSPLASFFWKSEDGAGIDRETVYYCFHGPDPSLLIDTLRTGVLLGARVAAALDRARIPALIDDHRAAAYSEKLQYLRAYTLSVGRKVLVPVYLTLQQLVKCHALLLAGSVEGGILRDASSALELVGALNIELERMGWDVSKFIEAAAKFYVGVEERQPFQVKNGLLAKLCLDILLRSVVPVWSTLLLDAALGDSVTQAIRTIQDAIGAAWSRPKLQSSRDAAARVLDFQGVPNVPVARVRVFHDHVLVDQWCESTVCMDVDEDISELVT